MWASLDLNFNYFSVSSTLFNPRQVTEGASECDLGCNLCMEGDVPVDAVYFIPFPGTTGNKSK